MHALYKTLNKTIHILVHAWNNLPIRTHIFLCQQNEHLRARACVSEPRPAKFKLKSRQVSSYVLNHFRDFQNTIFFSCKTSYPTTWLHLKVTEGGYWHLFLSLAFSFSYSFFLISFVIGDFWCDVFVDCFVILVG